MVVKIGKKQPKTHTNQELPSVGTQLLGQSEPHYYALGYSHPDLPGTLILPHQFCFGKDVSFHSLLQIFFCRLA
jgi:hypothetical protein